MTLTKTADLLIVEDNPNDLELTLRALKKNPMAKNIQVFKDGAETLDYLFSQGRYALHPPSPLPKVIFLDLKLPKIDGIEVLRQIKSQERTRTIPVVVLTSSQQERDVLESYRLGVNSYIVKPVDFAKLVDSISQVSVYWLNLNHPPR